MKSLGISSELIDKLLTMGISEPLPIQQLVIPAALRGDSVLVTSQTGSGKTLAYILPLLQLLSTCNDKRIKVLILAPTRELAQQIGAVCAQLCAEVQLKHCVVVGGVDYQQQKDSLALLPDIVVATPGRFIDLFEQGVVQISSLDYFVLDEVDQMLDLGFYETIIKLSKLRSCNSKTFCFSATLPNAVVDIVDQLSPSITRLSQGSDVPMVSSRVEHLGYYVSFEMMDSLLIHLLQVENPLQAIIFTRSRKMADRVVKLLSENKIVAEAMHSDRSQAARQHILERFRAQETSVIVATDVMARGIDIDSVTHVFNFGLPQSAEQYIHRCGRCGRVGRAGRALSIFTVEEKPILDAICRLMKRHIIIDHQHPYMTSEVTLGLANISQGVAKSRQKQKGKKSRR